MNTKKTIVWYTKRDIDGFFGLFTDSLTGLLTAIFFIVNILEFPKNIVFHHIVPAIVLSLGLGNIYLSVIAHRLGRREKRDDVTAIPYGLSIPHSFIVIFAIMLPVYQQTKDVELTWGIGMAWCFLHAVILFGGAFLGSYLRKVTPKSAMLGTLTGVAITFIAMNPTAQVAEYAWLGFTCFGIIMFGWLGEVKMPFNIPTGLLAILVGTILGWVTGYMHGDELKQSLTTINIYTPLPQFDLLMKGFKHISPYLVSILPLGVYLFISTVLNIESANIGGDKYNTKQIIFVIAGGTAIGAIFGSVFPTSLYIGHSAWKSMGARVGYSWITGIAIILLGFLGLWNFFLNVIPIIAIFPILIYIGMMMTKQAFNEVPKSHAPAVALAMMPWIANWTTTMINNTLSVAGTSVGELGYEALKQGGVFYKGLEIFGSSAILVGVFLGGICANIIDKKFLNVVYFSGVAGLCSFFGIIHASHLGLGVALYPALGYTSIALMGIYFHWKHKTS